MATLCIGPVATKTGPATGDTTVVVTVGWDSACEPGAGGNEEVDISEADLHRIHHPHLGRLGLHSEPRAPVGNVSF